MVIEERTDRPGVMAPPPVIYATGLGAGLVLQVIFPIGFPMPSPAAMALGAVCIGLGVLLVGSAFRAFSRAGTNANPYRPATAIVTNGPFRYTRNPMYVSLTLLYLGITLLLRSAWPVILLPLVLLIMRKGVIDREERYLAQKFGPTYDDYRRSVRRWA